MDGSSLIDTDSSATVLAFLGLLWLLIREQFQILNVDLCTEQTCLDKEISLLLEVC